MLNGPLDHESSLLFDFVLNVVDLWKEPSTIYFLETVVLPLSESGSRSVSHACQTYLYSLFDKNLYKNRESHEESGQVTKQRPLNRAHAIAPAFAGKRPTEQTANAFSPHIQ
jgi:hypothetical protein